MVGGGVLHGSSSSTIGTEPVVIGGHSISERRIVIASFSFALFVLSEATVKRGLHLEGYVQRR